MKKKNHNKIKAAAMMTITHGQMDRIMRLLILSTLLLTMGLAVRLAWLDNNEGAASTSTTTARAADAATTLAFSSSSSSSSLLLLRDTRSTATRTARTHPSEDEDEDDVEDPLVGVYSTPWGKKQKFHNFTITTTKKPQVQLLLPIFWHIPKSGGTSMKRLAQCLGLVGVHEGGGGAINTISSNEKVQIVPEQHDQTGPTSSSSNSRMVNVDVSTHAGILDAHQRGFAPFVAAAVVAGSPASSSQHQHQHQQQEEGIPVLQQLDSFHFSFGCGHDVEEEEENITVLNLLVATPLLQDAVHYLLTSPSTSTTSFVEQQESHDGDGSGEGAKALGATRTTTTVRVEGALFALFRHPVERAVSLFYYLQHADWESSYRPEWANTTLLELYEGGAGDTTSSKIPVERNWMTYYLAVAGRGLEDDRTHKKDGTLLRTPGGLRDNLEYAKMLLKEKMIVGLTDDMGESLRRFGLYFGWQQQQLDKNATAPASANNNNNSRWDSCRKSFTEHGANAFQHPEVKPGSPEWDAIAAANADDMELYEYALQVFEEQSAFFEEKKA